jgi:hypothetical protein
MFFDNIILFLNVLEQFAIRVTIFDIDVEDIIKYVNKLYFNNHDDLIKSLVTKASIINEPFDPKVFVRESLKDIDKKIINDDLFTRLNYDYNFYKDIHFRFIY